MQRRGGGVGEVPSRASLPVRGARFSGVQSCVRHEPSDVNKTWLVHDGNSRGSLNLVSARSGGSGRAGRKVWKSLHQ